MVCVDTFAELRRDQRAQFKCVETLLLIYHCLNVKLFEISKCNFTKDSLVLVSLGKFNVQSIHILGSI